MEWYIYAPFTVPGVLPLPVLPTPFCYTTSEKSDGIYCLQSGHVVFWHIDEVGNEIGFRVAGADEMLGHRAFFGEDTHAATAVALTSCVACRHRPDYLKLLMDKYPALNRLFLQLLALDEGPPDSLLLRITHLPVKMRLTNLPAGDPQAPVCKTGPRRCTGFRTAAEPERYQYHDRCPPGNCGTRDKGT